MNKDLIKIILEKKKTENAEDQLYMENLYKELVQHCYLYALSHVGFFKIAAFHGGTCLRIVDKIDRFSEDLDFALTTDDVSPTDVATNLNRARDFLSDLG